MSKLQQTLLRIKLSESKERLTSLAGLVLIEEWGRAKGMWARPPAEDLVKIDPSEWKDTFVEIHGEDLRLLPSCLAQLSVLAARIRAYIDARGGEGGIDKGHAEAV